MEEHRIPGFQPQIPAVSRGASRCDLNVETIGRDDAGGGVRCLRARVPRGLTSRVTVGETRHSPKGSGGRRGSFPVDSLGGLDKQVSAPRQQAVSENQGFHTKDAFSKALM